MATDFIATVKPSGGSYSSLTSLEAALQSDVSTAVTTSQVFAVSEASLAVIADGTAIKGQTSGATGTLEHHTTTQAYITSVSGTFQSGENIIKTDDSGSTITLDDAGDVVDNVVAECYAMDLTDDFSVVGWTMDATPFGTHSLIIRTPEAERHNGTDRDNSGVGFKISATSAGSGVIRTAELNLTIDGLNVENSDDVVLFSNSNSNFFKAIDCVLSRTGSGGTGYVVGSDATWEFENPIITSVQRGLDFRGMNSFSLLNASVYGDGSHGILSDNDNNDTIKSSASGGFTTANWLQCSGSGRLHRKNASDDATDAVDTDDDDSVTLVVATDWVSGSATIATANLHLESGSNLEAAGTPTGTPTTDIDGDARDGTNPDIGADEFVAVGGGVIPFRHQPRGELTGVLRGAV